MRCRLCGGRSGWWRRCCVMCEQLHQVVATNQGAGLSLILDRLVATGAPREHIEAFLAADPDGSGSIRDHIVADMSNELLHALGQGGRQTAAEVKRIRQRGEWSRYNRRPPGGS